MQYFIQVVSSVNGVHDYPANSKQEVMNNLADIVITYEDQAQVTNLIVQEGAYIAKRPIGSLKELGTAPFIRVFDTVHNHLRNMEYEINNQKDNDNG